MAGRGGGAPTVAVKVDLERHVREGESPVLDTDGEGWLPSSESRVCLGMQPKVGGKLHLKLNTGTRPIANKYHEER